jgi:hypothetical protein
MSSLYVAYVFPAFPGRKGGMGCGADPFCCVPACRIRAEIASETDRVSGGNKNISDKPIRLKIFSPNVL